MDLAGTWTWLRAQGAQRRDTLKAVLQASRHDKRPSATALETIAVFINVWFVLLFVSLLYFPMAFPFACLTSFIFITLVILHV